MREDLGFAEFGSLAKRLIQFLESTHWSWPRRLRAGAEEADGGVGRRPGGLPH
jgi:hypothetical protein